MARLSCINDSHANPALLNLCKFEAMAGYKPVMAMVAVQFFLALNSLVGKAAVTQGMSIPVFITYRQIIATIVLGATTLLTIRKGECRLALGIKSFSLVFVAALVGVIMSQAFFYRGLQLSSATVASAVGNSVPAITFVMAAGIGLEKIQMNARSMGKVLGTLICVGGAISVALLKGPKLLNMEFQTLSSLIDAVGDDWIKGCLFIFSSNCCWSFWLILQVPICERYLDPLPFSTWMCLFGSLQSAVLAYSSDSSLGAWKINSRIIVLCLLYTGIVGSAVLFYLQSWCISIRGPLFTAMFNPLSTVIVTISASLFLHEELYIGSLVGSAAVIAGLYLVLWGKAKDLSTRRELVVAEEYTKITISVDELSRDSNIKEPLTRSLLHDDASDTK